MEATPYPWYVSLSLAECSTKPTLIEYRHSSTLKRIAPSFPISITSYVLANDNSLN